jgi:precorrin-6B methylase 2
MNDGQKVLFGEDVKNDYVKNYMKSHENKNIDYRIGYANYYMLDAIMDKEYSIMDIGAGTCGIYQDLRKVEKLIAVDGSKKMLEGAELLLKDYSFEKEFINSLYDENFSYNGRVDALVLGVYGSYLPITKSILTHSLKFLNKEGVMVFNLHIPDTLYKKIGVLGKILLGKKPITQYEFILEKFLLPKNCEIILKVHKFPQRIKNPEQSIVYFIRKKI